MILAYSLTIALYFLHNIAAFSFTAFPNNLQYFIFIEILTITCLIREDCSYDSGLFMIHGVSILEDLVITLSDGIVSIYLELISVDSNFSDEMDGVSFALCTLSTRALQRLRNEVQFENSLDSLVA